MLTAMRGQSLHPIGAASPWRKAKPMRRIMTALAIVWLASAGFMAALKMSRTAASAAVMSSPKGTSP
jgi:hypothetical protein